MSRLIGAAENLATRLERHTDVLGQAQEQSGNLVETLEQASKSALTVKGSMSQRSGWTNWWPHIICPTASLVLGSYGLHPSASRNLALITLGSSFVVGTRRTHADINSGELAGMAVAAGRHLPFAFWATFQPNDIAEETHNKTLSFNHWVDGSEAAAFPDLRRRRAAI